MKVEASFNGSKHWSDFKAQYKWELNGLELSFFKEALHTNNLICHIYKFNVHTICVLKNKLYEFFQSRGEWTNNIDEVYTTLDKIHNNFNKTDKKYIYIMFLYF